jgi:hypothetical protein
MPASKKPRQMKVTQTAVTRGFGSMRPTVEGLELPAMDTPHIIIRLKGEEFDLYAVMDERVARNLREELNINLR